MGIVDEVPELEIKLSDLYPIDAAAGGDIKLPVTRERLRMRLEDARYQLAVFRCQSMLNKLAKRRGSIGDSNCIPVQDH